MNLKGNVRTLIMRRGRAAWVWVMFMMSLLHPSSHTPPVSTAIQVSIYGASPLTLPYCLCFHCFISALVRVTWCFLIPACVSVALPQGPDAHLTPTGIAVDTSGDFIFLAWDCGTCQKRLKSQLLHLCSASVPMMADSGRTLTLDLQRMKASGLGLYLLCYVASW